MISKQSTRGMLSAAAVALVASATGTAQAAVVTIDFEGPSFVESSSAGSVVPGVTFANDQIAAAGSTLNEFDYPPRSGTQALLDAAGPIEVSFAAGVYSVGAYVTYATAVTLEAFDSLGASLGQIASSYAENFVGAAPGQGTPNEFLSFSDAAGRIHSVRFSGDPLGSSFVLDDLSFDDGRVAQVSAPPTLLLAGLGLVWAASTRRRSSSQPALGQAGAVAR